MKNGVSGLRTMSNICMILAVLGFFAGFIAATVYGAPCIFAGILACVVFVCSSFTLSAFATMAEAASVYLEKEYKKKAIAENKIKIDNNRSTHQRI